MRTKVVLIAVGVILGSWATGSSTAIAGQYVDAGCKLLAPDGAAGDWFGLGVALGPDIVAIGARGDDDNGTNSGSVYIFDHAGGWLDKLTADDGTQGDEFGCSIAIDGDFMLIGALYDYELGGRDGAVYVFHRAAGVWTQYQKLTASDGRGGDEFGIDVALDGDVALIGARRKGYDGPGAAYVFRNVGGTWLQEQKLLASDGDDGDEFGFGLDLDGEFALIGSSWDEAAGYGTGSAYMFRYNGVSWEETQKLYAFDVAGSDRDRFGVSIALDGSTALVGAHLHNPGVLDAGAVYVFRYDATTGSWDSHGEKLVAPDAEVNDVFGISVDLEGTTALVGSRWDDDNGTDSGSAYVFVDEGGVWTFQEKLVAPDGAAGDFLGSLLSVALYNDQILVGAYGDDDLGTQSGSAWIARGCAPQNTSPTAVAGEDQAIRCLGDTVHLDGSASFDDNTGSASLTYNWSFSILPSGSGAELFNADTATPSFIADVAGTYKVQLIVIDEGALSSEPDYVMISTDNLAPTAVATVDYTLAVVGVTAYFDGTGSFDPEGDALTYAWSLTSAPVGSTAALIGADTPTPTLTPDLEGDYVVTLRVSDCLGEGTPDSVGITVSEASTFAENEILAACDYIQSLAPSQVKTLGNQQALCNFLRQAIRQLQAGQIDNALDKLYKAMERTDGALLHGGPDGNGPGMDWITDSAAQIMVYTHLNNAVNALEL